MLCEKCGKNAATTHIETNINGKISVQNLCAECAAKEGFNASFGLDTMLDNFFGDALKARPLTDTRKRCEGCGITFDDIARTGKVGCDRCYDTFLPQLLPSLQRMHGRSRHAGKIPAAKSTSKATQSVADELDQLRSQLNECIEKQDFEQAAVLRDRIKETEDKRNG